MITRGSEVIRLFCDRSEAAQKVWEKNKGTQMLGLSTEVVYGLTMADIKHVCERTDHALGTVRREGVEQVVSIRDWSPPIPFMHLFHMMVEELGALMTFQEFQGYAKYMEEYRDLLYNPAMTKVAQCTQPNAGAAMRWRIGNAYYSFLRELHVLTWLREAGIDARMHVLADILFKTDIWVDDTLISLYIGNSKFRGEGGGRKISPQKLLSDADPPFKFLDVDLPIQRVFGTVHLAGSDSLIGLGKSLSAES